MSVPFKLLLEDVYNARENYLAEKSAAPVKINFEELVASFFCPGPHYYYILDSPTLHFEYESKDTSRILGQSITHEPLEVLLNRVHPDDIPFMVKCEGIVADFLRTQVEPEKITKYKINYCIRERVADGSYRLFLMQNTTLSTTTDGALLKVLGVHADITHISAMNNHKLSFIGLDGEPSFLGLDVWSDAIDFKARPQKVSARERQVLQWLAHGCTARETAAQLHISEETVISHKKNLMNRFECRNAVQLVAFAIRNGFI
ncbi:MAG TPA: hypothetical protein DCG19_11615 [Cryomorphaceae bacterium]|nr:hypothetical protein [Owenweeksia sp.]MBF99624.1 hypothetical protein [Owenweeksia sp.]HAD98046.1 hypothetical protein [Cryomorphaceae bacterium]HBF22026.1 hypothetical protein [Cryomorphaceae bacterium]HCQ16464.1 hypothetical protein [Cryomorphaceae bacterium]|tara:strand:- start:851 stop:1630 length:780 start_codon:yes stop_codon:yes gene_type:complete